MKSTLCGRGIQRVWSGMVAVIMTMSVVSLVGCNKSETPTAPSTPANSTSTTGTESAASGGAVTDADAKSAGGNRDENSRPLNPEKFGTQ